jgi:hypothetical protein
MLIDTQISSYPVPAAIWFNGYDGAPNLPPLHLPARDATAIERRAMKRVNLRNETRRYTLCCERIQGIVQELSQEPGVLPEPLVWSAHSRSDAGIPNARSYLAIMNLMGRWMAKFLANLPAEEHQFIYPRVSALFFPPGDAELHLKCFELASKHSDLQRLFERAARDATLESSSFAVSATQCENAFHMRYELLEAVAAEGYGLVDVLELV